MKILVLLGCLFIMVACATSTLEKEVQRLREPEKIVEKTFNQSSETSPNAKELGSKAGKALKYITEKGKEFLEGFDEETNAKEKISEGANSVKEHLSKIADKIKK